MPTSIYLAGGFRSGWQARVKNSLPGFIFFDPSTHNLDNPHDYVAWDLGAIKASEVILAYLEPDNPGGFALAFELGYAKAFNKLTLLIEGHPSTQRHRSFTMIRYAVDHCFNSLEDAIGFVQENLS